MSRPCLRRWLLAVACLAPSPLGAQTAPGAAYDVLLDDVGTWDAEIVVWDPHRRPHASRGVETNTLGCGGTCLVTTVHGNLRAATRGMDGVRVRTGMTADRGNSTPVPGSPGYIPSDAWSPDIVSAPGDVLRAADPPRPSMSADARIRALTGPVPAARTSFAYPKAGVRVVTLYAHDPKGREIRVARIVYTRRQ